MRYGISAAAIVVDQQRLLLVNHRTQAYDVWMPPGGKLEGSESIFDCAQREAFEETGLTVQPERMVYVQEFVAPGYHFCKFFIWCSSFSGRITLAHRAPEEDFLRDARFFAQNELAPLAVVPAIVRDQFWHDLAANFPHTRYLGLQHVDE
jgi:8-oxo-dGTP diphosphatase